MHALDSSGRQVSLLNDEPGWLPPRYGQSCGPRPRLAHCTAAAAGHHPPPTRTYLMSRTISASSPTTTAPGLIRSDSYDSQASSSSDLASPLTPPAATMYYDYGRARSYTSVLSHDDYPDPSSSPGSSSFSSSSPSSSSSSCLGQQPVLVDLVDPKYDEDAASAVPAPPTAPEKAGKRYPCRYRDSHGCDKTFTTSGHASRHSKIHTAEKAVPCTHPGCQKKFTRADNMKQHLETHFKDKVRAGSSAPHKSHSGFLDPASGTDPALASAGSRSSRASSIHHSSHIPAAAAVAAWEMDQFQSPLASPAGVPSCSHPWDSTAGFDMALFGRAGVSRTPSGLDALAMAVACQEDSMPR